MVARTGSSESVSLKERFIFRVASSGSFTREVQLLVYRVVTLFAYRDTSSVSNKSCTVKIVKRCGSIPWILSRMVHDYRGKLSFRNNYDRSFSNDPCGSLFFERGNELNIAKRWNVD